VRATGFENVQPDSPAYEGVRPRKDPDDDPSFAQQVLQGEWGRVGITCDPESTGRDDISERLGMVLRRWRAHHDRRELVAFLQSILDDLDG
jgi:hypothetical protein